ncbi:probable DNA double-strand break repair Rad50 ATPase [Schistocerca nitens]|uniref:probable DNA double-strand break repair Rad50 ATPase n=1 Tax=Schistocerca nitens TaxID=7011 RepID=UPI002117F93A|nr:probable DNA double-strand break repair Rad50 ATPase [Schistocerca nitens]
MCRRNSPALHADSSRVSRHPPDGRAAPMDAFRLFWLLANSSYIDLLKEVKATRERGEILQESLEKNSQETRESLEKGLQETKESLKDELQETREEGRISRELLEKGLRESLEKSSQETRESLKEDLQEIKTSQMKMEYNLKKEMQELQERLKMDIDERERKLQKSIDQIQGDVEKMEGKLAKKIEDDIEETKAELGERINEVETNCNHRIAEVTQMQKQCNDAVKGIGDRQNELAVNLRNAIAVQREEDNKRVEMEVKQLQQGVQQLESKTEEIDKRISNATLAIAGATRLAQQGSAEGPVFARPLLEAEVSEDAAPGTLECIRKWPASRGFVDTKSCRWCPVIVAHSFLQRIAQ